MKKIILLALIKKEGIVRNYLKIKAELLEKYGEELGLENFLIYFESTYIGKYDEDFNIVTEPRYSLSFWCVNDQVLNELPYHNNNLEAWNNKLRNRGGIDHPNIAMFTHLLKDMEIDDKFQILRANEGILDWADIQYERNYKILNALRFEENFSEDGIMNALGLIYKFEFDN